MKLAAIALGIASMLLAQLEPALPATSGMSASQLEVASKILAGEIASGRVLAASLLVARREKIVLHRGYGKLAPTGESKQVKPDTVFLLASISKPVTASALMLLVERGKVSLNDPARVYLPDLAHAEIRVRDLLSHTSGMPDMLPDGGIGKRCAGLDILARSK